MTIVMVIYNGSTVVNILLLLASNRSLKSSQDIARDSCLEEVVTGWFVMDASFVAKLKVLIFSTAVVKWSLSRALDEFQESVSQNNWRR
jgi:hypothetical protein